MVAQLPEHCDCLKHTPDVETRFYCPQALLSLDFHCRDGRFCKNIHILGLKRAVRLYSRHANLGIAAISLASTVRRAVSTAASTTSRTYSRTCTKPNTGQGMQIASLIHKLIHSLLHSVAHSSQPLFRFCAVLHSFSACLSPEGQYMCTPK